MICAVCCPGPSLPETWRGRGDYDMVWAVNRALIVVEADWLSAADIGLYQGLLDGVLPRVGSITSRATADMIAAFPKWGQVTTWEKSPHITEHQAFRPVQWSVQAALLHAADLGATSIDLHGTGGNGEQADCTGYLGENRNPERWAREAADLSATFLFLANHGVSVHRILPRNESESA